MNISLSQLLEESFQIAWEYLERTELGDGAIASRFLSDTIEAMIRRGQRSQLALSDRAIAAYQRFRVSAATVSSTHFSWNMSRVFVHACKETAERRDQEKVRHRCFKRRCITQL